MTHSASGEYTQFMRRELEMSGRLGRARNKAATFRRNLGEMIRRLVAIVAGDPERSIDEFRQLSGGGNSQGWRFDREELHRRR